MSTILDLVNVEFVDETGYSTPQESRDTMGIVMDYHWGPSDSLQVMNQTQFFENYPESLPIGVSQINPNQNVYGYGQVKQAFRNGLRTVEVCRFATSVDGISRTNAWKYSQLAIEMNKAGAQETDPHTVNIPTVMTASASQFGSAEDTLYISYKYAGVPPQSLVPSGYNYLWLRVTEYTNGTTLKVEVCATQTNQFTDERVLESFVGGINKTPVNGVSNYLPDVVAGSEFIAAYYTGVESDWTGRQITYAGESTPETIPAAAFKLYNDLLPVSSFEDEAPNVADVYVTKYGDIELSDSKMLISPYQTDQPTGWDVTIPDPDDDFYYNNIPDGIGMFIKHPIASINEALQLISERRYNCHTVLSYPILTSYWTVNGTGEWTSEPVVAEVEVPAHWTITGVQKFTAEPTIVEVATEAGSYWTVNGAGHYNSEPTKEQVTPGEGDPYWTVSGVEVYATEPTVTEVSGESYWTVNGEGHYITSEPTKAQVEASSYWTVNGEGHYTEEPVVAEVESDNFNKAQIATWLSWDLTNEKFMTSHPTSAPYRYKFTQAICAREFISVLGQVIRSGAAGGWCGATARVAKEVRLNQPASAKQYGSYVGYLEKSLKFGDVNLLHGIGATSIYTAASGPRVFGIHTLCPTFTSYFAQTNVMRVTEAVLNEVLPASLNAIHTQVAADPIDMSSFEVSLNGILEKYIATRNLKSSSNAICNATINTERLTEKGKKLNIILNLWYINLTEKVSIRVVATDESVTAEFIQ